MRRRVGEAWRAWVALMDRKEPATALAVVRIGLASIMLLDFLRVAQLGLVDSIWSPPPVGFGNPATGWAASVGVSTLWALAVVGLACVALGAATRVACVVVVLATAKLSQIAPNSESAIDYLARIVFVILALSRCNARWSVDAWIARRLGKPMPDEVPAWPRYLLLLQVVWVYFSGGQNKAGASWGPFGGFTALANALADPNAARFDPAWVSTAYPVTRLATLATMVFELGAPLYLLFLYYAETAARPGRLRRICNRLHLRWAWIGLGIAFELGIGVLLRLGAFPWAMLALFPVLLRPGELQRRDSRRS